MFTKLVKTNVFTKLVKTNVFTKLVKTNVSTKCTNKGRGLKEVRILVQCYVDSAIMVIHLNSFNFIGLRHLAECYCRNFDTSEESFVIAVIARAKRVKLT